MTEISYEIINCGLCGAHVSLEELEKENNTNTDITKNLNRSTSTQSSLTGTWKLDCIKTLMEVLFGCGDHYLIGYFQKVNYCPNCQQRLRDMDFSWRKLNIIYNRLKTLSRDITSLIEKQYTEIKSKSVSEDVLETRSLLTTQDIGCFNTLGQESHIEMLYKGISAIGENNKEWIITMDNRSISVDTKKKTISNLEDTKDTPEVVGYLNDAEEKFTNNIIEAHIKTEIDYEIEYADGDDMSNSSGCAENIDNDMAIEEFTVKNELLYTTPTPVDNENTETVKISCPVCSKVFNDKNKFTRHKRYSCGVKIDNTNGNFDDRTEEDDRSHRRANSCFKENEFTSKAKQQCPSQANSTKKIYECDVRKKTFNTTSNQKEHMTSHKEEKDYVCKFENCGKRYTHKVSLAVHMVQHTGVQSYKCDICGKTFFLSWELKSHLHHHSGQRPHECEVCKKAFTTKAHLRNHHTAFHTNIKKYVCPVENCGKSYAQSSSMTKHKRRHGVLPHPCDLCEKRFLEPAALQDHLKTHTGEKEHLCTECGKRFLRISQLNNHMRTHTGEKPFKCDTCGLRFSHSSVLKIHKMVHTGERPYKCSYCGKGFTMLLRKNAHEKTHTQENLCICDICGKSFISSCYLNRHLKVHTGERRFGCDICSKRFQKSANLKRHKKTHTKENPSAIGSSTEVISGS